MSTRGFPRQPLLGCEPKSAGAVSQREIRERILAVKVATTALGFQAEPRHPFERTGIEFGAIGREQDPGARRGEFEGSSEEILKMLLYLPPASLIASGEGWRIQDDDVELLPAP